jgi:nicotinamidase-related amidase
MSPTYATTDTALLLVDVLNDFLHEDGKIAGAIGPMLETLNLKANLQRLVDGARAAGVRIVYVPHGLHEHSFDGVEHVHPRLQAAMDNKVFWTGEWGSEVYAPLQPRQGDLVAGRHRSYDGFAGTDLLDLLRAGKTKKVVLAGLTSHTCIESTGRHALEEGFHVTFLTDAVAEFTEAAHKAAVELSYPTFGHATITVDEFLRSVG